MSMTRRIQAFEERHRDLAFEFIRIYLGAGLMAKGVFFAMNVDEVMATMSAGAMDVGNIFLAHYVALAHLVGGFMLLIGLLTRTAALVQIPILLGAVFLVHLREGLFERTQNLEFSLLVLFLLGLIFLHGGGRLSVDQRLFGTAKQRLREEELGDQAPISGPA